LSQYYIKENDTNDAARIINLMAPGTTWLGWRLPTVKYSALLPSQSKNRSRSRSCSIGSEENQPFNQGNAVNNDEDHLEPAVRMYPLKKVYYRFWPRVALLCVLFLACGTLLGYGLRMWRDSVDNSATDTVATETQFGNEYNKFIYKENEFGERYCPNEDLTLRAEWQKMSRVEKRQFLQAVKCLKRKPSKTRPTGTLFEDFAFVRGQIGVRSKCPNIVVNGKQDANHCVAIGVASFFPWHRYLLWVFERELKNSCGYPGGIP
jgi:hypothetical protein